MLTDSLILASPVPTILITDFAWDNYRMSTGIQPSKILAGILVKVLSNFYHPFNFFNCFSLLGIRLRYNDGKVFVKCLSKHAIFVQSRNCNAIYQNHPTTVCKVPPENELIIFDDSSFASLLTESAKKDYQSVFELSKMCTIRYMFTLFKIFILFVQKFNFDFPRKLSILFGEKLVKILWFWTF